MDLRKLTYFLRISEDGSLTRAAGVLRVAQPALSRQLRLLEEELDTTLFNRTKKGMTLTQEGDYLYNSIVGPLRDLDRALLNFRASSSGIDGNLNIGMPAEVGAVLAPRLIAQLRERLPRIKPRIVENYSGTLRDLITRGIIDFGVLEGSWHQGTLPSVEVHSERLVLVGPKAAHLDPDRAMGFKEVASLPLIVPCQPFGVRGVLNEAALESRTTLNVALEIDSPSIALNMVADGHYYTVLPEEYFARTANDDVAFTHIVKPEIKIHLYLTSRGLWDSPRGGQRGLDKILAEIIRQLLRDDRAVVGDERPLPAAPQ